MIVRLKRSTRSQAATIGTATSSATAVRIEDAAGGVVIVGPLTASLSVTIYSGASDGSVAALVDGGVVQTLPLAASTAPASYALPEPVFASRYLRLVATGETACTVAVKS